VEELTMGANRNIFSAFFLSVAFSQFWDSSNKMTSNLIKFSLTNGGPR
jgi:hypothetical protein